MAAIAHRGHVVDEKLDHPPAPEVGRRSVHQRADANEEPVFQNTELELERVGQRRSARGRCGERELVDAIDWQIESRAKATENERNDAATSRAGRNGEKDRVRHETLPVGDGSRLQGMSSTGLVLRTDRADGAAVLHVVGELDLSTIAVFDAELEQLHGDDLVVVLTECTFIDSSALRSLVQAQRTARDAGNDLALVAPSQPARRVLEVAALDRVMRVYESLDDAVVSLT